MKVESNLNTEEKTISEFRHLLNQLSEEVQRGKSFTSTIKTFANNLHPLPAEPVPNGEAKTPQGVLDHIWEQVYALRYTNDELYSILKHLENIIGN